MTELLQRLRGQQMPLLLGLLALVVAASGAIGISFARAPTTTRQPVRAASGTHAATRAPTHASTGPVVSVGPVTVTWGDSTALASWKAVPGAAGYRVTLIRAQDKGIMEQVDVSASQLYFDAQGIWPGEQYVVAVQPLDSAKHAGTPFYSHPGQSVPFPRVSYNGFLDTMGLPQGPLDHNLWDQRGYVDDGIPSTNSSFINNQIHGHIETGEVAIEQSFATISPRPAFDFTGRTGHIHGEVDFHGDVATWFAIMIGPRHIDGSEMIDNADRGVGRGIPFLEVLNHNTGDVAHSQLQLLESPGNGADNLELGSADVPDYSLVNVRNFVDAYVSTTHFKLVVDGHTLFDRELPMALPFSVGYLTLAAESYPKVDEDRFGHALPCDVAITGACNVWHLDNWGFDAPAGQAAQLATTENLDPNCTEFGATLRTDTVCERQNLVFNGSAGETHSVTVNVADASQTSAARVIFDAYRSFVPGSIQVSLNGSPWQTVPWQSTPNDAGWLHQVLQANLPLSALKTGANTVSFRVTRPADSAFLGNVTIDQTRTYAYTPPALPPEPAPIGVWGGSIPQS